MFFHFLLFSSARLDSRLTLSRLCSAIAVQDRSIEHECGDKVLNPSQADMQLQVEKAQSVWDTEVEGDAGSLVLVKTSASQSLGMPQGSVSVAVAGHEEKARGSGGGGGGTAKTTRKAKNLSENVALLAAQARAKSAKDFADAQASLKRSMSAGEHLLGVTAVKILGSEERVNEDSTLSLVKSRMDLATLALDDSQGQKAKTACEALYKAAMQDVYLKDLGGSIFKDPSSILTVGAAAYQRNVTFELQPNKFAVENQLDSHRNAISALKKIAEALMTEVESWRTHVIALRKAQDQEAKATEKAEKKNREAEARRQKKEREKEAAAAAKKAKADAEAADKAEGQEEAKRQRRRRAACTHEIDEADPLVLQEMSKFSADNMAVYESVADFVHGVCTKPMKACCVRLKKGHIRKVLQDT